MSKPLSVALLGAGVVGSQVARIILGEQDSLEQRIGRRLELVGIGVRNVEAPREGIDPALLTDDLMGLVTRGDLDVVIELIGGLEPARELVEAAIAHGASVVTANKALLADVLGPLSRAAAERGVDLYYEAAVAGAIPIIRPLRESLVGDEITEVMGIVNGTTNYILDKMVTDQVSFESALSEAQALGYAEADPTADVEGHDAAAKAAILAGLAFHTEVTRDEVFCEGITSITSDDIAAAEQMGCTVKLLATAKLTEDGNRVIVKVHPAMVSRKHPLAAVSGARNAIFVDSREAGELMFVGAGAGGAPTASAVMGDVVTVARNRRRGTAGHVGAAYTHRLVAPIGESSAQFYISFQVVDRPGVLARCAALFGDHGVSLRIVQQSYAEESSGQQHSARLGIMTHATREENISQVLGELRQADYVASEVRMMRVEGF